LKLQGIKRQESVQITRWQRRYSCRRTRRLGWGTKPNN